MLLVLGEATDIAICEQVALSVRIGDIDSGEVRSMLSGVEEVSSPTVVQIISTEARKLEEDPIPPLNLIGYTSDGTNLSDRKNPVLTIINNTGKINQSCSLSLHCTCHQLHLCSSAACKVYPGNTEEFL